MSAAVFTVFTDMPTRLPQWMWRPIRWCGLLVTAGLVGTAFGAPSIALRAFWAVFVPLAPIMFLVAPGLWRNVCPMATLNQLPRTLGISRGLTVPVQLARVAPVVSAALFLAVVPLRKVLLDDSGLSLGIFLLAVLLLALIGGFAFKGKSGWCSNFCPMLSVERFYNLAPVVTVANSHCRPCVGCTKNCYDFNPTAAHLADLHDESPQWAAFRTLFAGALPWLIVAFNTTPSVHGSVTPGSVAGVYGRLLLFCAAGAGTFHLITSATGLSSFKTVLLHVTAALNLFYWYITPLALASLGLSNEAARFGIQSAVAAVSVVWLVRAWPREDAFVASSFAPVGRAAPALLAAAASATASQVEVRFLGGPTAMASVGTSLLSIAEGNGVSMQAGCRMGMCGADPVQVIEGRENLSVSSGTEQATVARVGAGSNCRMACVARVQGPVLVSLDISASPADDAPTASPAFAIDPAVQRVVVIGNGAAGITAVHELRKLHPQCELTILGAEPYDFYNRMNVGKLVSETTSIANLYMLQMDWAESRRVRALLGTRATDIRRDDRVVLTDDGELLPYDRLILASGGFATKPRVEGFGMEGTFVLRTLDDGVAIQQFLRRRHCRTALVIGGGLLGLEAAHSISHLGIRVLVLDRNPWPLHRQLDEPAGALLSQLMRDLGVEILSSVQVQRLVADADGRVCRAEISNGRVLDVQAALAAAGVTADIDLAARSGLTVANGVVVDDALATSDPAIFAVGDVSEHRGHVGGLWPAAVEQARVAAANALGGGLRYESDAPSCVLKVAAIDLLSAGDLHATGDGATEVTVGDPANRRYRKLVIVDGEVRGGILIGYPELSDPVGSAVTQRLDVTDHLTALRAGDWSVLG